METLKKETFWLKKPKNSLIRSKDKLLVGLGLEDLIIVDTQDALLVANKKYSQEIKNIVSTLNNKNLKEGKHHKKIHRPWGFYISIEEKNYWQIKKSKLIQAHHYHYRSIIIDQNIGSWLKERRKYR